jgi:hypothetical protein
MTTHLRMNCLPQWPPRIMTDLRMNANRVESYGPSASLSWNKAPIWGLRPDFYFCHRVAGLLILGALSDERTGLLFTIAADPRQRIYFRVRVRWDLRPYFTVSDSRLPFPSPPTTRRATVEVFYTASTRVPMNVLLNVFPL